MNDLRAAELAIAAERTTVRSRVRERVRRYLCPSCPPLHPVDLDGAMRKH